MKWVFLILIKLYWIIFPEKKRRTCLFKETCSHYVYRSASGGGFFKGAIALQDRLKKCRKGYHLYTSPNGFEMELADGSIIDEAEIAPNLLEPIHKQMQDISGYSCKSNIPRKADVLDLFPRD